MDKKQITCKKEFYGLLKKELSRYNLSLKAWLLDYENFNVGRYIYHLRMAEWYSSRNGVGARMLSMWHKKRMRHYSYKTGFQIGLYTCGWGLIIRHFGWIIVGSHCTIGNNCILSAGVNVGKTGDGESPVIGNNVRLGFGCKVYGKIHIGDNVIIAPNAIISKDVPENVIVDGINKIIKTRKDVNSSEETNK